MIECKRAFIDTAPFIYLIEKSENNPQYYDKVREFFDKGYKNNIEFVTSVISMEEYLIFPYKLNSKVHIELFDKVLKTFTFKVVTIDDVIAKKAAKIRAEYNAFKSMDALQLSAAYISGCDLFLTNDKQLRQFAEIKVVTVDELK